MMRFALRSWGYNSTSGTYKVPNGSIVFRKVARSHGIAESEAHGYLTLIVSFCWLGMPRSK